MKRVIVESPYAGDVERNLTYLRRALADCLKHSEAPFASHAIYTQPGVLDDAIADDRRLGISAGFEWWHSVETIAFYIDYGFSNGMKAAHARAVERGHKIELREIGINP